MSPPARPVDIGHDMGLVELASHYATHRGALRWHDHGYPLGRDEFVSHALAALAYGHELAARAEAGRWCHAVDALASGATHQAVAAAMGLAAPDEMRIGLGVWAAEQHRHGFITDARRERIHELIGEGS